MPNENANTETATFPWENPSLGFFRRFWDTCVGVVIRPWRAFKQMPVAGGYLRPWLYYALCNATALAVTGAIHWLVPSIPWVVSAIKDLPKQMRELDVSSNVFQFLEGWHGDLIIWTWILAGILFAPFLYAAFAHVCLWAFGASRNGYQATFRAHVYAAGANSLLVAVPFLGGYVLWLWGLVISIVALKEAQQTDYWRVICAFFLPMFLLFAISLCLAAIAVLVILYVIFFSGFH